MLYSLTKNVAKKRGEGLAASEVGCILCMFVYVASLSSAVPNLILSCVHVSRDRQLIVIVLCPDTCPPPSPPICLIVSSLLRAVTSTWRPERPQPPASWIINILSVYCQYPPHTKWTWSHTCESPPPPTHTHTHTLAQPNMHFSTHPLFAACHSTHWGDSPFEPCMSQTLTPSLIPVFLRSYGSWSCWW